MNITRCVKTRVALLLASVLVAGGALLLVPITRGQVAAVATVHTPATDMADQLMRLVQNGKTDEISKLSIPRSDAQLSKMGDWTKEYLAEVSLQMKQRDQQYDDAVGKAQEQLKAGNVEKGTWYLMRAHMIAKDPNDFLALPWVKDAVDKAAGHAADLEKSGGWLESLYIYQYLDEMYKVSTRFKADVDRLTARVRLLVTYTPKAWIDMNKDLAKKEATPTTTPATQPEPADDLSGYTPWQDTTEKITLSMMRQAIETSQENWVEKTTYEIMTKGGIESLRLMLSTPQLASEFPALADAANRDKFNRALDDATTAIGAHAMEIDDVENTVAGLINASKASVKLPPEVLIMEFTTGAMGKLDQFSQVFWPHEVPEFEKNINGKFGGVGIQISLEGGQLKVISPLEDTPAYKAGIEAGDLITAIDGKTTMGISVDKAVNTIMGTPGTPVVLKIKRGNEEKDYKITRDTIKVQSVKGFERDAKDPTKWNFMLDPDSKIGYVRITGFQEDTPDELDAAITRLNKQGMAGLVIDLRENPGGLLNAAVDMCDMFLDDGMIVSTRGRPGTIVKNSEWRAHPPVQIPLNMPMIVLVNEHSASASEIFAGAMKDLHRALIVGHRSYGKGSVQNLLPLTPERRTDGFPEAMMKLTMAYYYLPNGENLHRRDKNTTWGVDPDVAVDLTPDQLVDLLKARRDNDVIKPSGARAPESVPATAPATTTAEAPAPDTQLETAMLMMRLELVKP